MTSDGGRTHEGKEIPAIRPRFQASGRGRPRPARTLHGPWGTSKPAPPMSSDTRGLLFGSAPFDSVVDSYRRALSDPYVVRHVDPFSTFGGIENRLGPQIALRVTSGVEFLMRAITREPLAMAEPRL